MALINIASVINTAIITLKKTLPPGGIELLSYKRNRGIAIIKKSNNILQIREYGYFEQEFDTSFETFEKKLKTIIKREFPRSRKIRLLKFNNPAELDRTLQKI